jgi:hypothetical protein
MKKFSFRQPIASTVTEIMNKHLHPHGPLEMTATEIKNYLELVSGQKLSLNKVGEALVVLRYQPVTITAGSLRKTVYSCGIR